MMNKAKSKNIEAIYPLSPMQQGMLFHTIYNPGSGEYFEQLIATFSGSIDVPAFEKAWQMVIQQNAILRTSFVWKKMTKMLQVVHKEVSLPFELLDWRSLSEGEQKARFDNLMEQDRNLGFNLGKPPLLRLKLIRVSDSGYKFLWSHHHILLDGWSIPVLLREVFLFYEAFKNGRTPGVSPAKPYSAYISWLQQRDMETEKEFWSEYLQGFTAPTPLMVESIPAKEEQETYKKIGIQLAADLSSSLQNLVQKYQITLNTLLQAVWALLLYRYSNEDDIVFGATFSGRPASLIGSEEMIGLFINTLPVRVKVPSEEKIGKWLIDLHSMHATLRDFEYSSLSDIQGWSSVPRNLPLFKSIFVFENYPVDSSVINQMMSFKISNVQSFERTNYPLTVVSAPGEKIGIDIAFETAMFNSATIERMLHHLETMLVDISHNPNKQISDISLLTTSEKKIILEDWNQTNISYPDDLCIHQWFEKTVEKRYDHAAVTLNGESLTYGQLNEKANRLAHYLHHEGVKQETLVGICLERSMEMIIAILGVLKAGGAYVPIDPLYPIDRIDYMIKDSGISILLTQEALLETSMDDSITTIYLDDKWSELISFSPENPVNINVPYNLAYVIYTSGSTGQPKGTMLQHQGFCNLINNMIVDFNLGYESIILQFASFSFDAAVAEIFMALLPGAMLQLAPKETLLSLDQLQKLLQEAKVTTITFPPSMLNILPSVGEAGKNLYPDLKTVVSVGESCSWEVQDNWSRNRQFLNGYGPTEATVGATWCPIEEMLGTATVPIGGPIGNVSIYILDSRLRPVPLGVSGELYISGAGLARGYLNRPDLTAEKFIPNPYSNEPGTRMYKTGDLVRYLSQGHLEFAGRVDHQVKIRGLRIELGEIESVFIKHENIRAAVAIAREDIPGQKQIVTYLIPSQGIMPDIGELKSFAKDKLPDYMLPSAIVLMKEFPLTPNGKINRKSLPKPDYNEAIGVKNYVAPHTPTAQILTSIWEDVLRVEKVGSESNFFELGGHSLLATQVSARIRDAFQIELPIHHIFETTDLADLANVIDEIRKSESEVQFPPLKASKNNTEAPLSFAQQRLWFIDQLEPGSHLYNIPSALRLSGNLQLSVLEATVSELVRRHSILRTTFINVEGEAKQKISPNFMVKIPIVSLEHLDLVRREKEAKRIAIEEAGGAFDLEKGPLFRTLLIRLSNDEHVIVFNMHHIIADGWSMSVVVREIASLYRSFIHGRPSELTELSVQYSDFAIWQRNWLRGEALQNQVEFWRKHLLGAPPVLELPTDNPRPAIQTYNGAQQTLHLSDELSSQTLKLSRQLGATPYMLLISVFKMLLSRYSGQEDIVVGTPIANRRYSETEQLIGFFVNTLAIRTDLSGNPKFTDLVRQVRATLLAAYAHQDIPFEKLVEELNPERDLSHSPIFQVAFMLQNLPTEKFEISGLTMAPLEVRTETAKYDLVFYMGERNGRFSGTLEYNTDLFFPSTISLMLNHFRHLLELVIENPNSNIAAIPLLEGSEYKRIIYDWNKTSAPYPSNQTVPLWFEQNVEHHPNDPAVLFVPQSQDGTEKQVLSYLELNRRANQLARFLQKLDVGPEIPVGISLERSIEMMIGIMGVLKAGGTFVPIDPAYPVSRIAHMLDDSGVRVVLTQQHLVEKLRTVSFVHEDLPSGRNHPGAQLNFVRLDEDWNQIARENNENIPGKILPDNLAYIIYTSGSTGLPKGTMLGHRGLCNLATAQIKAFDVRPGKRILQFSSLSFDASVWETVMGLLSGAALYITTQDVVASGVQLTSFLQRERITTLTLPPSVLAVLPYESRQEELVLPELETLITAGEKVSGELVDIWKPGRNYFNAYGPTETTVCASMHLCRGRYPQGPPIGKPINNFELYVLDKYAQPVPVGVPGELHIGGVGLARGYLNHPELTAEKFIPHPFSNATGLRLYKSGDLARYLPDGNIEFLGRIDHQVKVRGFRIEIGEIEAVLSGHPGILDVAVLARVDLATDTRLAAYIIPQNGNTIQISEVRAFLRNRLPEYMVPSYFTILDSMPLTPNGKVNRSALPKPDTSRADLQNNYIAPRNDTEEKLAKIAAELLGVDKVGVHDNFFELGGHSLLATQFMSRLKSVFQMELPLRQIFETPTISELSLVLIENQDNVSPEQEVIEKVERGEANLDELLTKLNELSDDEVRALLANESSISNQKEKENE